MAQLKHTPLFTTYLLWVAVLVTHSAWVIYSGGFRDIMGDESYIIFIILFFAATLLFLAIGASLAWLIKHNKTWALWAFSIYCAFIAISTSWGIGVNLKSNSSPVTTVDILFHVFSVAILVFLIWLAWQKCPNKSLNRTRPIGLVATQLKRYNFD